jgi:hypothetical protein
MSLDSHMYQSTGKSLIVDHVQHCFGLTLCCWSRIRVTARPLARAPALTRYEISLKFRKISLTFSDVAPENWDLLILLRNFGLPNFLSTLIQKPSLWHDSYTSKNCPCFSCLFVYIVVYLFRFLYYELSKVLFNLIIFFTLIDGEVRKFLSLFICD